MTEKSSFDVRVQSAAEAMCEWRGAHHPDRATCRLHEELARVALNAAGVPSLEATIDRASLIREAVRSSRAHFEKIAKDALSKAEELHAKNAEMRSILRIFVDAFEVFEMPGLAAQARRVLGDERDEGES